MLCTCMGGYVILTYGKLNCSLFKCHCLLDCKSPLHIIKKSAYVTIPCFWLLPPPQVTAPTLHAIVKTHLAMLAALPWKVLVFMYGATILRQASGLTKDNKKWSMRPTRNVAARSVQTSPQLKPVPTLLLAPTAKTKRASVTGLLV